MPKKNLDPFGTFLIGRLKYTLFNPSTKRFRFLPTF